MADALFAKVQQRVLGLFGNPGRSFYANEVIGLAHSGTGAVQREMARLEAAGLVTATRIGKQKHYQANPASPVFAELRALVLKTFGLADVLREALTPVADRVRAAFVYGGGADFNLTSHVFMRAEYRGFVYNSPTYNLSSLDGTDRITHRAEPSVGFGYRF